MSYRGVTPTAASRRCRMVSSSSRPIEEKPTPSSVTLSPRRYSVMFFQLSILGVIASTVSGSSARKNSSACSENTTPKPQVAPAGFCSNRSIGPPDAAFSRDRRNRDLRVLRRSRRYARSFSLMTCQVTGHRRKRGRRANRNGPYVAFIARTSRARPGMPARARLPARQALDDTAATCRYVTAQRTGIAAARRAQHEDHLARPHRPQHSSAQQRGPRRRGARSRGRRICGSARCRRRGAAADRVDGLLAFCGKL